MRFAFTEDQRLFGRTVGELLEKECTPEHLRAVIANDEPRALWSSLASLGVVGMTAAETHGGLGGDEIDIVLPLEVAGKAALPDPLVETVAVGIPLLRDHANEDARARWLADVASGAVSLGVSMEDPQTVLDADVVDIMLLRDGESVHLVGRDAVTSTRIPSLDPARRLFEVSWTPSRSTVVATGADVITAANVRGALATSAVLLGVAARMITMAARYATERQQFGKPIGSFQAVKHHLANALMHLEFARPVVYRAAHSMAHALPERTRDVSMAKAYASDAAVFAARVALQVHGAIGYTEESDVHLWLKRAYALASAWGVASRHREIVARTLLG